MLEKITPEELHELMQFFAERPAININAFMKEAGRGYHQYQKARTAGVMTRQFYDALMAVAPKYGYGHKAETEIETPNL